MSDNYIPFSEALMLGESLPTCRGMSARYDYNDDGGYGISAGCRLTNAALALGMKKDFTLKELIPKGILNVVKDFLREKYPWLDTFIGNQVFKTIVKETDRSGSPIEKIAGYVQRIEREHDPKLNQKGIVEKEEENVKETVSV